MKYLIIFFILSGIVVIAILSNINPNFLNSVNKIFSHKEENIVNSFSADKKNNQELNFSNKSLPEAPKQKPKFDVVRVTSEGSSVIAGTAPKFSIIKIYEGDKLIGETKTNNTGEWVLIPEKEFEEGTIELTIESTLEDGTKIFSDEIVIISVPKKNKTNSKPIAILSEKNKLTPSKVLQNENRLNLDKEKNIVIDIIDYDDEGNIIISGRSLPNLELKIYLNNKIVGKSISDDAGIWVSKISKKIIPGNYDLKVELIDNNKIIGLANTPFTRISEENLKFSENNIIVQPGNSLWRIARKVYGSGFRYTIIFEANKNQINNPDLIFPGQIFKIPKD